MKKNLILIGIIAVVVLAIYLWPSKPAPVEKIEAPKAIPSQPIIQYDCGECKG
jgi:hypothetical protein